MTLNLTEIPPIPVILIIGGIVFLVFTVVESIAGKIKLSPKRQRTSGIIGSVLIILGIVIYFVPPPNSSEATLTVTPTETLPVSLATSAILPSDTPVAMETATPTASPNIGFEKDCISSLYWTPSPESVSFTKANNCWDLSSDGIAAQNGNLLFAIQNDIPQAGSLYMVIPKQGVVKFKVRIDKFVSGETNGNLVFGVGTVNDWLTEGEFLFFRATDSGYYIVYGNSVIEVGKRTIDSYKIGSDVIVAFQFNNLTFDIYINNTKIVSDIPLSASNSQVFWVGYRLPVKSKLVASVSDFSVEK